MDFPQISGIKAAVFTGIFDGCQVRPGASQVTKLGFTDMSMATMVMTHNFETDPSRVTNMNQYELWCTCVCIYIYIYIVIIELHIYIEMYMQSLVTPRLSL